MRLKYQDIGAHQAELCPLLSPGIITGKCRCLDKWMDNAWTNHSRKTTRKRGQNATFCLVTTPKLPLFEG